MKLKLVLVDVRKLTLQVVLHIKSQFSAKLKQSEASPEGCIKMKSKCGLLAFIWLIIPFLETGETGK